MTPARTVLVLPHYEGVVNAHGNPARVWGLPRAELVFGWAPAGTAEPAQAGRDEVTQDLDLLVPPGFSCSPLDLVVIPGKGALEVEGHVQDYTSGPFEYAPGGVVRLRRVEG